LRSMLYMQEGVTAHKGLGFCELRSVWGALHSGNLTFSFRHGGILLR
jgi:hypothetical protein